MDGWVWSNGGMVLTGETEVLGEKSVLYPFYPPPGSHKLPCDRTEASGE